MSAWHDDIVSAPGTVEESRTVHVDGRCRPSESLRSTSKDSQTSAFISSADVSHVHCSSAWSDDDVAPVNITEQSSATRLNGGSGLLEAFKSVGKNSCPASSTSLPEISSTNEASAWYDDVHTPSDISEKDHVTQSSSSRTSDSSRTFVGKYSQTISGPSADGSPTNENCAWDDDIGATLLASEENHAVSFESFPVQASEPSFDTKPYVSGPDLSAESANIRPYDFVTSKAQSSGLIAQEGDREGFLSGDLNMVNSSELDRLPQAVPADKAAGSCTDINGFNIQNLSSHLSVLNLNKQSFMALPSMDTRDSVSDVYGEFRKSPPCLQQLCTENGTGNLYLRHSGGGTRRSEKTQQLSDWALEPQREASNAEVQHCASHVITHSSHLPYSSGTFFLSDASSNHTLRREVCALANEDFRTSDAELSERPHQSRGDNPLSNGHAERKFGCSEEVGKFVECPDPVSIGENPKYLGRLHNLPVGRNASVDTGESNIISNILSMDFDPWNDTSVSTDSFSKFLGETDEQNSGLKMTSLWKGQSNNQSRFSFARQESQTPFSRSSFSEFAHVQTNSPGVHGSLVDIQNGFAASSSRYPVGFNGDQSATLTEKSGGKYQLTVEFPESFVL